MSEQQGQTPAQKPKSLMQKQDEVKTRLLGFISDSQSKGEVPKNYSPNNALNSAWLYLIETKDKNGNNALETCSPASVMTALMKMLQYGLNVVKNQCYLIPYGGKLQCDISYHGLELIAKRDGGLVSLISNAIYEADTFTYEVDNDTGLKKIKEHKQDLESIGDGTKIKGSYAIATFEDGRKELTIMTKAQIMKAWNQRQGNGLTQAHQNFTDEMAQKTVRKRALKNAIGSSDDSSMMDSDDIRPPAKEATRSKQSNKEAFDFHEEIESTPVTTSTKTDMADTADKSEVGEQMEAPFA